MLFGELIAVAREESCLSLRELAVKAGTSAATLSKVESAEHIPRDPLVTRLIQVLRLDEHAVWTQVARQRMARYADAQPPEKETALSPVPIVGKIQPER